MPLGRRIAALLVLAVWSCLLLYGSIVLRSRRADLLRDALADARETGNTLDVVLNEVLEHTPLSELDHLPDQIARADRIAGFALLDASRHTLLASRDMGPYEARVRALAERALASGRPLPLDLNIGATLAGYAFPLRDRQQRVVGVAVVLRDLSYIEGALSRARLRLLGLGALIAGIAALVAVLATQRALGRPIARLIEGVRRVGEGDLAQRIPLEGQDEVGRIAAALNQMMEDLARARAQRDEEISQRAELAHSIELERKLQHTQRLAAVGQIAASLGHEIGSPLHVIAGRARYAAERDDSFELKENLRVIATQADRITRVVEQLLNVARRRSPKLEPVVLRDVVEGVRELIGPHARSQKVRVLFEDNAPGARVAGDADMLQQVVFNLVMNAMQVQPDGGEVTIALDRAEVADSLGNPRARVVLEVRDRGPGVPEGKREAIFEPFTTGRADQGGTGLGLSVVRGIVREHDGSVRVLDNPGGGALFRVALPPYEEEERR